VSTDQPIKKPTHYDPNQIAVALNYDGIEGVRL